MNKLLERYVNARHKSNKWCYCPDCCNMVTKKSEAHVYCNVTCKNGFWNKIRGFPGLGAPIYPGGHEQWKKDLKKAEEEIVENMLLEGVDMRYLVHIKDGEAVAVFMHEIDAESFAAFDPDKYRVKEILVEDVHEYL